MVPSFSEFLDFRVLTKIEKANTELQTAPSSDVFERNLCHKLLVVGDIGVGKTYAFIYHD